MQMFGVRALRSAKFTPCIGPRLLAPALISKPPMLFRAFAVPTVKDKTVFVTFTNRTGKLTEFSYQQRLRMFQHKKLTMSDNF